MSFENVKMQKFPVIGRFRGQVIGLTVACSHSLIGASCYMLYFIQIINLKCVGQKMVRYFCMLPFTWKERKKERRLI